eukprot:SAG22_NODE_52_length_24288_cov_15.594568_25_plen_751_part_00
MSKGRKFANPMLDMEVNDDAVEEAVSSIHGATGTKPVIIGKPELGKEELSDLAFAFEACDLDDGGTIDADELQAVLAVFGAKLAAGTVKALQAKAKAGRKKKEAEGKTTGKKRKNKKGADMSVEHPEDLNFPEFVYLMTEGLVDEYFSENGWEEGAYHMRLLKSAYVTADLDGNNELEFEELSTSINSLHTGTLSEQDIEYMWEVMNPQRKPFLTFQEFLEGMVSVQEDPKLNKKFHLFSPDALMSLVLDTPVSLKEEKEITDHFTLMEKFGMSVLSRSAKEMSGDEKTALLIKAQKGTIHVVTEDQKKALSSLHSRNVYQCLAAGFFSAAGTAVAENLLLVELSTDGAANPNNCLYLDDDGNPDPTAGGETNCLNKIPSTCSYPCRMPLMCPDGGNGENFTMTKDNECQISPEEDIIAFWAVMGIALGICCSFEIGAMYFYSIQNSVRVANAMDLRLKPLNRDRSFVGGSLVRAALELGNTQGVLFGVDPLRETSTKGQIMAVVFAVLYLLKIAMSGFVIKVLMKRLMTRGGAKFALPWAAVPATAGWNGFVGHVIMREAKLRGVGVAAAVELFNDIVDPEKINDVSDLGRVQICRAIGCNIVKQRDMYPTKEILLKHAAGNLGLVKLGLIAKDQSGVIDDVPTFVSKIKDLTDTELHMTLHVLLLVTVLDGTVRGREMSLLQECIDQSGGKYTLNGTHVKLLAQRTRNMFPLQYEELVDCLSAAPSMEIPGNFYYNECGAKVSGCLAC